MESRFNYSNCFGCMSLSGDMSCVEVDRSRIITIFFLLSTIFYFYFFTNNTT